MASAGLAGDHITWMMKQERRTPGYTICRASMAVVQAGSKQELRCFALGTSPLDCH